MYYIPISYKILVNSCSRKNNTPEDDPSPLNALFVGKNSMGNLGGNLLNNLLNH